MLPNLGQKFPASPCEIFSSDQLLTIYVLFSEIKGWVSKPRYGFFFWQCIAKVEGESIRIITTEGDISEDAFDPGFFIRIRGIRREVHIEYHLCSRLMESQNIGIVYPSSQVRIGNFSEFTMIVINYRRSLDSNFVGKERPAPILEENRSRDFCISARCVVRKHHRYLRRSLSAYYGATRDLPRHLGVSACQIIGSGNTQLDLTSGRGHYGWNHNRQFRAVWTLRKSV